MRAALMTTMHDYLGYRYTSGQVCHGYCGCTRCMDDTTSVLWDLEYWPNHDTPHCLDQMHIMKNVLASLLGTLMNTPEKTKDGPKVRKDLEDLKIRKDLHRKKLMEETETEMETEEGGKGQKSQQEGGELLPPFLLHLMCEGDRSNHQVPYGNQS